jgi:flagellar hook-basal body complex protein FliE
MKNILEIMKEYGLEVAEEKQKDFEKAVLENYKTVNEFEKQKEKLETANETIKTNNEAIDGLKKDLEGFKDVDVTGLQNKIAELESKTSTIESEYQAKLADRDFQDILKENITSLNGKNAKAITALLNMDELKASKNQKDDIAKALKELSILPLQALHQVIQI